MSHSPLEEAAGPALPDSEATDMSKDGEDYAEGWLAINKLMRSGWSWSGNEANNAFLNLGPDPDGVPRFVDASNAIGFDQVTDGRAVVRMDLDSDGDLDLLTTSRDGPRLRVFQNGLASGHHFIALRLVEGRGNPTAIGARVELRWPMGTQDQRGEGSVRPQILTATVKAGEGFLSQQSSWLHLGLGQTVADSSAELPPLSVRWADGTKESYTGLQADGWYILERGAEQARPWTPPTKASVLRPGALVSDPASQRSRIVLPQPLALPELPLLEADGTERRIFGIRAGGQAKGLGRPLLINLWASWCAPCITELKALGEAAPKLGSLGILALSVDKGEAQAEATRQLEAINWPFPTAFASEETQAVIGVLIGALLDTEEPLGIPLGLLINSSGELVCVYRGPVDPGRLVGDLRLLKADPAERAFLATPFQGIWYRAPEAPAAALLEARFRARGLEAQARDANRAQQEVKQGDQGRVLYQLARRAMDGGDLAEVIDLLQRAIQADQTMPEAYADLGVALHRQGSYAKAVDAYSAALLLKEEPAVRAKLGLSYVQLGRLDLAEKQVQALRQAGQPQAEPLAQEIQRARDRNR